MRKLEQKQKHRSSKVTNQSQFPRRFWAPLILLVVVTGIYFPSIENGFLYDDYEVILSHPPIQSIEDVGHVFTERHFPTLPYYRPVVRFSLLLQRAIHGDQPQPFHAFNVLLMGVAAVLAYGLLRLPIFNLEPLPALIASFLFALHPVASSCVYPIASGRETLMPGVFILLAIYCYLRNGLYWRLGAMLAFALALFSKEQAVVTLVIFVLADFFRISASPSPSNIFRRMGNYLPEVIICTVYLLIRHSLFGGEEYVFGNLTTFVLSFLYALQVFITPFAKLIYEPPVEIWLTPWRLVISCTTILWIFVRLLKLPSSIRPMLYFWLAWFFCMLLPTANLLQQEAPFAERYVFLAGLGPAFLTASAFKTYEKSKYLLIWKCSLTLVILVFAALTFHRSTYFQDYEIFCRNWLSTNPKSPNAHNSMAVVLTMEGKLEEAGLHYKEAIKLIPDSAETYNNLASLRIQQGDNLAASDLLQKALSLDPNSSSIYNNLATLFLSQGKTEEAIPAFSRAIDLNPDHFQAHANLANALAHQGKISQALMHYREALRINPDWPQVANRLAWILATHTNSHFRQGKESVQLSEQACQATDYSNPLFLDTLAAAYAEVGQFERALETAELAKNIAASKELFNLTIQIQERILAYLKHRPIRYSTIQWRSIRTPMATY